MLLVGNGKSHLKHYRLKADLNYREKIIFKIIFRCKNDEVDLKNI